MDTLHTKAHLDLKLDNIMYAWDGTVLLIDFGRALSFRDVELRMH